MEFKELFRIKYRNALLCARANDEEGTIAGLSDLYSLFAEQYSKKNGDSMVVKAKLSNWQDTFGSYIQIIRKFGLKDARVQKFFGLIDDSCNPSFSDILSGKGNAPVPAEPPVGEVDIAGIIPSMEEKEQPTPVTVEPKPVEIEPTEPTPVAPIAPKMLEDKPLYTPDSLKDFIGQEKIVKALLKEIAIAKNEGRKHLDNILLFGNPGLGKTTLMKLIAKELGVKFEFLDCSQFRNSQQSLKALQNFFMRIARDNEPVVIALDEVHMLNRELQSSLLTLLNDREYVSPLDINGQSKRFAIDEFTFIAATTNDEDVIDTIKNRCLRLKFQMVDYTSDELKLIYRNKVSAKGLTIDDEAIETCIPRSRGAIRYVNSIVEGLDSALYSDDGVRLSTHIDLATALKYFEEKGIDPMGLEAKDLEILRALEGGAMGADMLSAKVGLETKKYINEFEKYLIKIDFVSVTGKGRTLTEKAINYLKGEG